MIGDEPRIIEQNGDIVRIVAGKIEVLAQMTCTNDEITLRRFSIDGQGPATLGLAKLKELARQFARLQGVRVVRVYGTVRTTGANPGKMPRAVVIRI